MQVNIEVPTIFQPKMTAIVAMVAPSTSIHNTETLLPAPKTLRHQRFWSNPTQHPLLNPHPLWYTSQCTTMCTKSKDHWWNTTKLTWWMVTHWSCHYLPLPDWMQCWNILHAHFHIGYHQTKSTINTNNTFNDNDNDSEPSTAGDTIQPYCTIVNARDLAGSLDTRWQP